MGRYGDADRPVRPGRQARSPALRGRRDAAHALPAAMVRPVGSGDGRSAARRTAVPEVRRAGQLDGAATGGSTILRFRHPLGKHKLAAQIFTLVNDILRDKGLMLRAGTIVDRDADQRVEFDQERRGRTHPGIASEQEKATSGTLA